MNSDKQDKQSYALRGITCLLLCLFFFFFFFFSIVVCSFHPQNVSLQAGEGVSVSGSQGSRSSAGQELASPLKKRKTAGHIKAAGQSPCVTTLPTHVFTNKLTMLFFLPVSQPDYLL